MILLHENARPHVAKATGPYLCVMLGTSPVAYSLHVTPSDYYLFRLLQHHLTDTHFMKFEEIRKCIDDFIASKPVSFFRQGIRKLPERWQKVVDRNGEYFAANIFCLFLNKDLILQKKHRIFLYTS